MNKRLRNVLLVAGLLILIFLLWYFRSIVTYIIIASILSVMGRPMVRWLKKIKIRRFKLGASFSALITLLVLLSFFIGLFRFSLPLLASKFSELSSINIDDYLSQIEEPFNRLTIFLYGEPIALNSGALSSIITDRFASTLKVSHITDLFGTIASTLGSIMIGFFSVSFITFFFLREENMFRNGILMLVPIEYEKRFSKIIERVAYLLRRYFIGIVLEVVMVMALDTLGLTIVGLDFSDAVVIGMFCGLFNVIPYLGPWLGAFSGLLIGLALNINADFMSVTLPLLALMSIVFVAVQVIDNILFQPLIYSSSVKAHPLEIFLVILAAGSVAGVMGMILAIPVYTIFRVFGAEFLSEIKFIRKLTANMEKEVEAKMAKKKS
ncbi:MAG TPA: AI-2E family transporter [Prolixibacteraceae bacterium]|nr:AI-2E family transporter [Prolixibacteraceae bacterium]